MSPTGSSSPPFGLRSRGKFRFRDTSLSSKVGVHRTPATVTPHGVALGLDPVSTGNLGGWTGTGSEPSGDSGPERYPRTLGFTYTTNVGAVQRTVCPSSNHRGLGGDGPAGRGYHRGGFPSRVTGPTESWTGYSPVTVGQAPRHWDRPLTSPPTADTGPTSPIWKTLHLERRHKPSPQLPPFM